VSDGFDPHDDGRPRYGEYASPEEQRARIRQPDATQALETGQAPAPAASPAPAATPATPVRSGRGRLIDRIATIALLAYGLLTVVTSVPLMFALAEGENGYLGLLGMTEPLSDRTAAQIWGAVAGSVFLIGWLLTAWISWANLRRGRISFWIPLVGAFVFSALSTVLMLVPALGDPAFVAFLQEFAQNPTLS
jgi:hypothetical protein